MYVGVRAGGGIGDEIEDPAGDPYEMYRIVFDITFFFFVIVILLAIIQGMLTSYVVCTGLSLVLFTFLHLSLNCFLKRVSCVHLLVNSNDISRHLLYRSPKIYPGSDTRNLNILAEDHPPSLPNLN